MRKTIQIFITFYSQIAPGNEESRALPVEDDITNVQGSVRTGDDVSREHRIVEDCEQDENATAAFMNEPMSYQNCDIAMGRDTQYELQPCCMQKIFGLNAIRETLEDVMHVFDLCVGRTIEV